MNKESLQKKGINLATIAVAGLEVSVLMAAPKENNAMMVALYLAIGAFVFSMARGIYLADRS